MDELFGSAVLKQEGTKVYYDAVREARHCAASAYATKRATQRKRAYAKRKEVDKVAPGALWLAHYEGFMEGVKST